MSYMGQLAPPFYTNWGYASGTSGGLVSTGTQTFAGNKTWTGTQTYTPVAATSGSASQWTYNVAADTGLTASTESPYFKTVAATRQWATGALTLQRSFLVDAPTIAFVGASTVSDAASFAVAGPPVAGPNATLTKAWSAVFGTPAATTTAAGANAVGIFGAGATNLVLRDTTNSHEALFQINSNTLTFGSKTAAQISIITNNAQKLNISSTGRFTFTPNATAGGATSFVFTPPADTGLTASAEVNIFRQDGATRTWADGTTALQRDFYVRLNTLAKTTTSATFTDAATFAVEGAPAAGSGVTITKPWSAVFGTPSATNLSAGANAVGIFGAGQTQLVIRNTSNNVEGALYTTTNSLLLQTITANNLALGVAGFNIFTLDTSGRITNTPRAATSGSTAQWVQNVAADTGLTAATEVPVFKTVTATRTWADGTTATQRDYIFAANTLAKTTTSATFTDAATVAITGAPIAGAGVTITRGYPLWTQGGTPRFDSTTANATTATVLGSLGPAGANTTVQEWLTININGNTRYIPCF